LLGTRFHDVADPLSDGATKDTQAAPFVSWTGLVSLAVACGVVVRLMSTPALANDMLGGNEQNPLLQPPASGLVLPPAEDPEQAAVEARADLQKVNEEKKLAEKEARLREKLAIKKMAEDKKKAEQVIQENVRAEVDKIKLEKELALGSLQDKQRDALARAVAANQLAETAGEEKRMQKLNLTAGMEPQKKALQKALAEKQTADDDAAFRKDFANKAEARMEEAEKLAGEKKAIVESLVTELAKAP